jgi:hypothetical protein
MLYRFYYQFENPAFIIMLFNVGFGGLSLLPYGDMLWQ